MAWIAERAGRFGTRDVLLTLAIASSAPEDDWTLIAWLRLLEATPNHFFAIYPSLSVALDNPGVARSLNKLRQSFPPSRIEHLLARAAVSSGPYYGCAIPLRIVIDDLVGSRTMLHAKPNGSQRPSSQPKRHDSSKQTVVAARQEMKTSSDSVRTRSRVESMQSQRDELIPALYMSVLLGLAIIFVSSLTEKDLKESRAA